MKIIGEKAYIKDSVDSYYAGEWGIVEHKDNYGFYHIAMYGDNRSCAVFARDEFVIHRKNGNQK